ncbi:hypothetical protein PZ938_00265, partial [Luteipulveratus sp. YIM 133132]|uniref:hypothetical protein n=1 Tax=Luteipulveratus flavus TaxID=3031728 RepID=UPI0023AF5E05
MTSAASSEPGYTPLLDRLAFAAATPLQAADAFDSAQQALRRATEAGDDPALHRAVAAAAVLDDRIGGRWGISGADLVREEHTLQRATLQGPEDHPLDDAVAVILRDRADRGWTERGNPGVDVEALSAA